MLRKEPVMENPLKEARVMRDRMESNSNCNSQQTAERIRIKYLEAINVATIRHYDKIKLAQLWVEYGIFAKKHLYQDMVSDEVIKASEEAAKILLEFKTKDHDCELDCALALASAYSIRDDKESVEKEMQIWNKLVEHGGSNYVGNLAKATMKLATMQQGEEQVKTLCDAIKLFEAAISIGVRISPHNEEEYNRGRKVIEDFIRDALDCFNMLPAIENKYPLNPDSNLMEREMEIARLKIEISDINPERYLDSTIYYLSDLSININNYAKDLKKYQALLAKSKRELTKEEKEQMKSLRGRWQNWGNREAPTFLALIGENYFIKLLETWWKRTSNYNHTSLSTNKSFLFLISPKKIKYHFEKTLGGERLNDEIYTLDLLRELLKEVIHDDKREFETMRECYRFDKLYHELKYQPLEWAEEMAKELDVTELKEKLAAEDMTGYDDVCDKEDFIALERKRLDNPINDFAPSGGMFPLMNDDY
jgi:hypothetical protein